MRLINPQNLLVDPDFRPFIFDFRHDLTAPDAPIQAAGRFVLCDLKPDQGNVYVIKAMSFYAMERTDPGGLTETARLIAPNVGSGFFSYNPLVNDNAPFLVNSNVNQMRLAATPLDQDRIETGGLTHISETPYADVQYAMMNPWLSVFVPTDQHFRVIFSIIPQGVTPMPIMGQFAIAGAGGARRVDYAGVVLAGVSIPEQTYKNVVAELRQVRG